MPHLEPDMPRLNISNGTSVTASGCWQVHALALPDVMPALMQQIGSLPEPAEASWDLTGIEALDHIGAQWFWNIWKKKRPRQLALALMQEGHFRRIEQAGELVLPAERRRALSLAQVWHWAARLVHHLFGLTMLIGQLMLDIAQFARQPQRGPWKEISANVFHAGYRALGITALVGFLIGIVLSYLSSQQLHTFGGDIFIVNILGMSIIRELGPLLAAILVAGRSGSSITAQIGVMRVTEELDAMLVMGLPHGFRLIMPKVIALALAMPLLVIWTDAMALLGGMAAAHIELGLSPVYFLQKLPSAVPLANFWIGLGKGLVFGTVIALIACHFGLRIRPNTESLGHGTTISVVTSITLVILADAVFAIVFSGVGFR
ncbi:MAG: transport system permease protein [Burkholderiaceae bacterium]|nr:transport system permease protein [Burkholderiaceae bacterium]